MLFFDVFGTCVTFVRGIYVDILRGVRTRATSLKIVCCTFNPICLMTSKLNLNLMISVTPQTLKHK